MYFATDDLSISAEVRHHRGYIRLHGFSFLGFTYFFSSCSERSTRTGSIFREALTLGVKCGGRVCLFIFVVVVVLIVVLVVVLVVLVICLHLTTTLSHQTRSEILESLCRVLRRALEVDKTPCSVQLPPSETPRGTTVNSVIITPLRIDWRQRPDDASH